MRMSIVIPIDTPSKASGSLVFRKGLGLTIVEEPVQKGRGFEEVASVLLIREDVLKEEVDVTAGDAWNLGFEKRGSGGKLTQKVDKSIVSEKKGEEQQDPGKVGSREGEKAEEVHLKKLEYDAVLILGKNLVD